MSDSLTDAEFGALLADESKFVNDDITWTEGPQHWNFECRVYTRDERGLLLKGSIHRRLPRAKFVLLLHGVGRVYALDVGGHTHTNPDGEKLGELHKHSWTEVERDGWAYVPNDITATPGEVQDLWQQFCTEANIQHFGRFYPPPERQLEIPT